MKFRCSGDSVLGDLEAVLPFVKIIAFGYEDGPSNGVAQNADRATGYRFDLLAVDVDGDHCHDAWDRGKELRIFQLAPLPFGSFERIVLVLSAAEEPNWPVWVPGIKRPADELNQIMSERIDPILVEADSPRLVSATTGLRAEPLACREVADRNVKVQSDWFSYLGLDPQGLPPNRIFAGTR